jgi:3'-phosphoadenosine 5'-phosphosulfate sulfotransferase
MEAIALEPQQGYRQSSVNAYVTGAASKLLEYQRINEDKDYIEASRNGHQLIAFTDVVRAGEEVQRMGIEEITDNLSSNPIVLDYATMPGPDQLRTALQMLHDGHNVADVARAIGTGSKHFRQTIRRIVDQMEPDQAAALEDWINYREFYSAPYAMDLSSIVAKLYSTRITKLVVAQTQRPDPTRARSPGRLGADKQIWMK